MPKDRISVSELPYCFRIKFSSNPKDAAVIRDCDLGWRFWGIGAIFGRCCSALIILSIERLGRGVEQKFE
jgi:hypothetical protein